MAHNRGQRSWSFTYTSLFCMYFLNFEEIKTNMDFLGYGNTCLHEELQMLLRTQTELVIYPFPYNSPCCSCCALAAKFTKSGEKRLTPS